MDNELTPEWMPAQRTRAYIYRTLTASMPIIQAYGIIDGNRAALWLGLFGTLLGVGLASANTPTS